MTLPQVEKGGAAHFPITNNNTDYQMYPDSHIDKGRLLSDRLQRPYDIFAII